VNHHPSHPNDFSECRSGTCAAYSQCKFITSDIRTCRAVCEYLGKACSDTDGRVGYWWDSLDACTTDLQLVYGHDQSGGACDSLFFTGVVARCLCV
jgi:hypothetical protein